MPLGIKRLHVLITIPVLQMLAACQTPMDAFIRNTGSAVVMLQVELFSTRNMPTLPNHVKAAKRVMPIKRSTKNRLDTTLIINWKDTRNFEVSIPGYTTVDLSDISGAFWNGRPASDCRVILDNGYFKDTLVEGGGIMRHEKFGYKPIWFLRGAYWYDTEVLSTP
jgi:hypothetical protein